jgi:hypothetical protein
MYTIYKCYTKSLKYITQTSNQKKKKYEVWYNVKKLKKGKRNNEKSINTDKLI